MRSPPSPPRGREPLETIATGFEEQGEAFFDSDEFGENFATVGQIANDECADEVLDVTAIDYGFEGIPAEVTAGLVGVNFSNEGAELHELRVPQERRRHPELRRAPAAERGRGLASSSPRPAARSPSPARAPHPARPREPGEYVAACFIPVGTTPESGEEGGSGPPHFTQGMKAEFTVS